MVNVSNRWMEFECPGGSHYGWHRDEVGVVVGPVLVEGDEEGWLELPGAPPEVANAYAVEVIERFGTGSDRATQVAAFADERTARDCAALLTRYLDAQGLTWPVTRTERGERFGTGEWSPPPIVDDEAPRTVVSNLVGGYVASVERN